MKEYILAGTIFIIIISSNSKNNYCKVICRLHLLIQIWIFIHFRAKNEHEEKKVDVNVKIEESEEVKVCIDEPGNNCPLIVQIKYCTKDPGFAVICCKSCTESGQLDGYVPPPPEVAKPDVEEDTSEMENEDVQEEVVEEEESSDEGSGIDEPELSEVEGSG